MVRRCVRLLLVAAGALLQLAACDSLVEVDNPGVIEADKLDPVGDGRIFSLAARQNFAVAYGQLILYGAWFTGEAISAETQTWFSEFDRRDVSAENGPLLGVWTALSVARASAERVVNGLTGSAGEATNVDLARAALFAGYSYLYMAESFCEGTVDAGPLMDSSGLLDRAIDHLSRAERVGHNASREGPLVDRTEGLVVSTAALVGRARARLQAGDRAGASTDAAHVPRGFLYDMWYSDDVTSRGRLGNVLWYYTAWRGALSVAPPFRNLNDPRVPVAPPTSDLPPIDGTTPLWTQQKYMSFGASIRLASGLEAEYVKAEATGASAMLALIQDRRAANGQPSYSGPLDENAVTQEFMRQRSREFFLEGKRLGDTRRRTGLVPDVPQVGSEYHRPGFEPVGDQTCWPLPAKETARLKG